MSSKKISFLPSGSINHIPLNASTIFSYSGSTYQHTLESLRFNLILSGSNTYNQPQIFDGDFLVRNDATFEKTVTAEKFVGDGSGLTNLTGTTEFDGLLSYGTSEIKFVSGATENLNTIHLKPDTRTEQDQYIILDPTTPNHIHIRAGGSIDMSNANLILGGEKRFISVNDMDDSIRLNNNSIRNINNYYFDSNNGYNQIQWFSEGESHYLSVTGASQDFFNAVWEFYGDPSILTINTEENSYNLAITGYNVDYNQQTVLLYVSLGPQDNSQITSLFFEIKRESDSYIEINGADIRMEAKDDLRMYAYDTLRLINYSESEGVEIITDYDNSEKRFTFTVDGEIEYPDGTRQETAFKENYEGDFNVNGSLKQNNKNVITSDNLNQIVILTQDEYNMLTPLPDVLYLIRNFTLE